jgi:uncharacterized protein DUF2877
MGVIATRAAVTAPHRAHVVRLGRAARRALTGESRWTVLARFRRSVYAQAADGQLVCLGSAALGAGPLNAIVDRSGDAWGAPGDLPPGTRGESDGSSVRLGAWVFALDRARTWTPPPVAAVWDRQVLERGLTRLAVAAGDAPADGLGRVIPMLATGETGGTPLLRLAGPAAIALAAWIADRGHLTVPPAEAEALIGLGPGLTPSGDDFLGGALVALHALRQSPRARRLAGWLWPRARTRTHAISLAHLACAAEGEAMAPLHAALRRLLAGGRDLAGALRAVGAVGHTSGWDALAGAWVAARGVARTIGR